MTRTQCSISRLIFSILAAVGLTLDLSAAAQAQVQVNAADPPSGVQGTTNLVVKVTGKGFKNGASAKWYLTGTTNPAGVTVNSTALVSSTELLADITIAADAPIANFDIVVSNADGRSGKGTELFAVTAPGNSAIQKCVDVPIQVTLLPPDNGTQAVFDDGGGTYKDGVGGVYNIVIHTCSGSFDATMGLITARRSMMFAFPEPYVGGNGTSEMNPAPAWAGTTFLAKPFMNVRRILWNRLTPAQGGPSAYTAVFTTRMGFTYLNGPRDKSDYGLVFSGESNDAGVPATDGSNFPYVSTPVTVMDFPGTCRQTPGGTLDHWIVTNAPAGAGANVPVPFLGALLKTVTNGSPLQSGQYVMPFKLLIEARSCVPF